MTRIDPLRGYRFRVEIDGIPQAGFSEVTFGVTDAGNYRERSDTAHARNATGLKKGGSITLKRGVTAAVEFLEWLNASKTRRKQVTICMLDETGTTKARYVVTGALPVKCVSSTLSAKGNDVAIEELELANEGIEAQ